MVIIGLFLNKEIRTGANRRYLELMEGLSQRGNTVIVAMNENLDYSALSFTKITIEVPYTRKGFPPASWLFSQKTKQLSKLIHESCAQLEKKTPDWILIHGSMHLPLAIKLKNNLNTKLFFAYRCNDVLRARLIRKSGLLSKLEILESLIFERLNLYRERLVNKHADLVCFQNQNDREDWINRVQANIEQTVIIHGNIGLPRCTDEWKNTNNADSLTTLIYIGAISVSKGLYQVFSVLHMLHLRGHTNLKLIVLGKTEGAEQVFTLAENLGLSSSITWPGYTQPFPYLAKASLMIFPSLYDAFPDTILEALHVGCPVISSNRGGIPDILDQAELLFDPKDILGMASLIERCIQNPEEYQKIRNLCKKRADIFRFDWPELWEIAMNTNL